MGAANRKYSYVTATIAASGTTSGAVGLDHKTITGIVLPVTTGDAITFSVSADGSTYQTLYEKDIADGAYTIAKTAAAASSHTIDANVFAGFTHVKVVSDETEGAERTIGLVLLEV